MPHLTRRLVLGFALALPFARVSHATPYRVSTNREGIAMQGYDAHAYWTTNAARPGDPLHVVEWRGKPWHFATAEDAEAFRADPLAYEPQFGGYCTRAMSLKKIVDGDPEVWRIFNGKPYLFAKPKGGRVFDKDQQPMIDKAQAYWDSLS